LVISICVKTSLRRKKKENLELTNSPFFLNDKNFVILPKRIFAVQLSVTTEAGKRRIATQSVNYLKSNKQVNK
jgi:hypothetical protein